MLPQPLQPHFAGGGTEGARRGAPVTASRLCAYATCCWCCCCCSCVLRCGDEPLMYPGVLEGFREGWRPAARALGAGAAAPGAWLGDLTRGPAPGGEFMRTVPGPGASRVLEDVIVDTCASSSCFSCSSLATVSSRLRTRDFSSSTSIASDETFSCALRKFLLTSCNCLFSSWISAWRFGHSGQGPPDAAVAGRLEVPQPEHRRHQHANPRTIASVVVERLPAAG